MNIKAGSGGLVDVEFAVQTLQLLCGWKSLALQSPNTLDALTASRAEGLLPNADGETLEEGYCFLRKVSAKLRILHERPRDSLPKDSQGLEELARSLGYQGDGAARQLLSDVKMHTGKIRTVYRKVISGEFCVE